MLIRVVPRDAHSAELSRLANQVTDQGKKFVKVYITIPGIENVPDEQVSLEFPSDGLKFDIVGLPKPPTNLRLSVATMHSAVDESQSTWVRKADSMIIIKLRKATEESWGSLDDSARAEEKRKAEKLEANKGKSTAELLSEMYANADEEGKASLSAAWEAGRSKREGKDK